MASRHTVPAKEGGCDVRLAYRAPPPPDRAQAQAQAQASALALALALAAGCCSSTRAAGGQIAAAPNGSIMPVPHPRPALPCLPCHASACARPAAPSARGRRRGRGRCAGRRLSSSSLMARPHAPLRCSSCHPFPSVQRRRCSTSPSSSTPRPSPFSSTFFLFAASVLAARTVAPSIRPVRPPIAPQKPRRPAHSTALSTITASDGLFDLAFEQYRRASSSSSPIQQVATSGNGRCACCQPASRPASD